MKTFLDSSAFAKRYIEEEGSQAVDDVCDAASELALSVICVPEIISALNRRRREKTLSREEYATAMRRLSEDVADAAIISLTPAVIGTCASLLEASVLRAMDALHVACALEWGAELFVSADEKQVRAARKAGLAARLV